MKTNVILGVAGIAAIAGVAVGSDVLITDVLASDTGSAQFAHFSSEAGSLSLPGLRAQAGVNGAPGGVQGGVRSLDFGVNGTATVAQPGQSNSSSNATNAFYLGTAAGLAAAQNNWFNTIAGGVNTVGQNTTVLGFGNAVVGNSDFSANRVVMEFTPGVQGFAFNFADIGDVSEAELIINYSDNTTSGNLFAGRTNGEVTGFFSLIVEAGKTIDRMVFRQTSPGGQDFNDGFLLYGFTTLTVVPLPPAAWAGLAMLGGVAGVRKLRRR